MSTTLSLYPEGLYPEVLGTQENSLTYWLVCGSFRVWGVGLSALELQSVECAVWGSDCLAWGLEFSGCLAECRISGLGFRTRSEGSGFI